MRRKEISRGLTRPISWLAMPSLVTSADVDRSVESILRVVRLMG